MKALHLRMTKAELFDTAKSNERDLLRKQGELTDLIGQQQAAMKAKQDEFETANQRITGLERELAHAQSALEHACAILNYYRNEAHRLR